MTRRYPGVRGVRVEVAQVGVQWMLRDDSVMTSTEARTGGPRIFMPMPLSATHGSLAASEESVLERAFQ